MARQCLPTPFAVTSGSAQLPDCSAGRSTALIMRRRRRAWRRRCRRRVLVEQRRATRRRITRLLVCSSRHISLVDDLASPSAASVASLESQNGRMTTRLLASPATGHRGTCPLDFQQFKFFSVDFRAAQSLRATLCGCLSKQVLYSATAAAVVQSRLREPCSVYYFASFDARRKSFMKFCPPCTRSWRRHYTRLLKFESETLLASLRRTFSFKYGTLTVLRLINFRNFQRGHGFTNKKILHRHRGLLR